MRVKVWHVVAISALVSLACMGLVGWLIYEYAFSYLAKG